MIGCSEEDVDEIEDEDEVDDYSSFSEESDEDGFNFLKVIIIIV